MQLVCFRAVTISTCAYILNLFGSSNLLKQEQTEYIDDIKLSKSSHQALEAYVETEYGSSKLYCQ